MSDIIGNARQNNRISYGGGQNGSYRGSGSQVAKKPQPIYQDYGWWAKEYHIEEEKFEQTVIRDTENIWIVAYIDPACDNCQKFAIEWERLQTVETIKYHTVKYGFVDVTLEASRTVVGKYTSGKNLEGTPTVYIYADDKLHPTEYTGQLESSQISDFATKVIEEYLEDFEDAPTVHELSTGKDAYYNAGGDKIKVIDATKIENKVIKGKARHNIRNGVMTPEKFVDTYEDELAEHYADEIAKEQGYGDDNHGHSHSHDHQEDQW